MDPGQSTHSTKSQSQDSRRTGYLSWILHYAQLVSIAIAIVSLLVSIASIVIGLAFPQGFLSPTRPKPRYQVLPQAFTPSLALNTCLVKNEGRSAANNIKIRVATGDGSRIQELYILPHGYSPHVVMDATSATIKWTEPLLSREIVRVTVRTSDPTDFECSAIWQQGDVPSQSSPNIKLVALASAIFTIVVMLCLYYLYRYYQYYSKRKRF